MTQHEHTIREAVPDDATDIASLYRQLVENPTITVLPARIVDIADDARTALFVVIGDSAVRGTALVSICMDAMFGHQPFAVVENIVVDRAVRGLGIGAALLRHVEMFSLAHDCSKIMLLSSSHREDAHRFFVKAGFAGSSKRGFIKYRRAFGASA